MKESCSWQTVCSVSPDDDEKAKRDAGKWWKPWVSQPGGEAAALRSSPSSQRETRGPDAERPVICRSSDTAVSF